MSDSPKWIKNHSRSERKVWLKKFLSRGLKLCAALTSHYSSIHRR